MPKRGRPFQPGNSFGRGRPKGSRNRKTVVIEELLEEYGPSLMRKGLAMALDGNVPLLRTFLERHLPKPQDSPAPIGRLPTGTAEELCRAQETVIKKLASGILTPHEALQINSVLESRREMIETRDLERRMNALETLASKDCAAS
jgi:hypothetical protein